MGILMRENVHWSPANWVARGLYQDLLEGGGLPPMLAAATQFCVEAELDTLDLRKASEEELRSLRELVERALFATEARGPASFQLPEFHPVYIDKLNDLLGQLDELVGVANDGGDYALLPREFPVGETLDGGAFRVTENLFGGGLDRVHLAVRVDAPAARYVVSSTFRGVPDIAELRRTLSYTCPGVLDLVFVGPFDAQGEGAGARVRSEYTAVVERVGEASTVRQLVRGPQPLADVVALGTGTGRLLEQAARAGHLLLDIRPESIWATREQGLLRVVGVSDRGERLFRAGKNVSYTSLPTYERRYTAPEIIKGLPTSERTLTFLLATMVAEWLSGAHPFPDAWSLRDAPSVAMGRHTPIVAPAPLRPLLERSLSVDPAMRPPLAELIEVLEA